MTIPANIPESNSMPDRPPLATLVEDVVNAIEQGIYQGRYMPGCQLVERDLASELGVSRIPVREALRRLAALRILEIRPYRGAVVRELSRSEALDVVEILNALGRLSIEKAVQNIDRENHAARLKKFISTKSRSDTRERKIKEWVDLNFPFYQLIAEISGNKLVPHLLRQFQLQMYRLAWNVNVLDHLPGSTLDDHRAIAEGILSRNARAALSAYRRHVDHTLQLINALPDSAFAESRAE
jgi:DNA-binding GntR family transcriptional regulator